MPTPCQKCGEWFELNEGRGSRRWYPDTVICSDCGEEEQEEIEREEEIKELEEEMTELEESFKYAKQEIREQEDIIQECVNNMKWIKKRLAELKKLQ